MSGASRAWFIAFALLVLAISSCATTPRDPIGRMHPYLWASHDQLHWFSCRWETDQPIGFAILGTDELETRQLRRVLDLWEGMGLGVRFVEVPAGAAQLTLAAVDGPLDRDDGSQGAGRTITDCKLDPDGDVASARLVRASVEVARAAGPDPLGKMRPLGRDAWLGSWVHEVGHALGYQGHLRRGDDPMRLEPDFQRFVGQRLMAAEPVVSGALQTLYARPSGSLLGSARLPPQRTADLDEIHAIAQQAGVEGPLLRAGDRAARLYWEDSRGKQYGFLVLDFPGVLREPETIVFFPEQTTLRELR